jgi:hydroxymethylpyrimidine pyrophosphatase-like HAD family hydrolase
MCSVIAMSRVRLLSTDFDGTLIAMGSKGRCTPQFAAVLERHKQRGGVWAINTGRSLNHTIDGLNHFGAPLEPDFLLTNEREIYGRNTDGLWMSHGDWNAVCRRRHEELFKQALRMFAFVERLAQETDSITVLYEEKIPAGLVTSSEEVMEMVANDIQKEAEHLPGFSFQRNSIYLRFCHSDYHKGSALGELCRLEGIEAGMVLAAGDHFNDLSMLDGSYAKMTACPANAIDAVKQVVRRSEGYIANRCWADGIAEALGFFENSRRGTNSSAASSGRDGDYAPGLSR